MYRLYCNFLSLFLLYVGAVDSDLVLKETFYETILQKRNYVKEVSPFDVTHQPVLVNISVPFQVLVSIKEDEQLASWIARVQLSWNDPRLAYNATSLNLTSVMVFSDLLWIPSLTVFNSVEVKFQDKESQSNIAEVFPDGRVMFLIRGFFVTVCSCDVTNFPFDTQRCSLGFDTNTAAHNFIVLRAVPTEKRVTFYMGTPEWTFKNHTFRDFWYGDNERNFSLAYADAYLVRNSHFYMCTFVYPTILISLCSLASLLLPLGMSSGEKMNVALASYLGLLFMLGVIVAEIPRSSSAPLLATWLMLQLSLCFAALCFEGILKLAVRVLKLKYLNKDTCLKSVRQRLDIAVFLIFVTFDAIISILMFIGDHEYVIPKKMPII